MQRTRCLVLQKQGFIVLSLLLLVVVLSILAQGIIYIVKQQAKTQQEYIRHRQIAILGTELLSVAVAQDNRENLQNQIFQEITLYPGAEKIVPQIIVEKVLKTNVDAMVTYWQSSTLGIIQSGAIGAHGHYANGLAALFLATGQDVACVAEAATGITRMEKQKDGSLYASVTMPNLIVGTVGGGTSLPSQRECLELMECYGPGNARKYAEICGGLILAGELSIAAALSAGQFSDAHKKFGRKKSK